MEPERFDRWTRRRFGLAAGGLVALVPALGWVLEGDAKPGKKAKKRKRDKPCPDCATCPTRCRKPRDTCEGGCCDGLVCDDTFCGPEGDVCCSQLDGPCKGTCDCCGAGTHCASDENGLFEVGTCQCFRTRCGDRCVFGDECCADEDCAGHAICDDGYCACPDGTYACGFSGTCCQNEPSETCAFTAGTCEQGGCPETNFCADAETYLCAEGSYCTLSIDGERVCLDFDDEPCVDCTSDAECQSLLGTEAACVPTGLYCDFCPTNYCARVHQTISMRQSRPQDNRATQVARKREVIAAASAAGAASSPHQIDKRSESTVRRDGQKRDGRGKQNDSGDIQAEGTRSRRGKSKKGNKDRCPPCPECSLGCEAVQQRCNGDCCEGLTCGQNFCQGPYDVCCRELDGACQESCDCCGEYSICRDGICGCRFQCGDECVARDDCCTDDECPDREVCRNGSCQCSPSTFNCGDSCCDFVTESEICPTDETPRTCQAGGCPVHDFCSDNFAYLCGGSNCWCATSIDGVNTCIGNPFGSTERIACASDAECETALGEPAVCIPDGTDCRFGMNICVRPGCSAPVAPQAAHAAATEPVASARDEKEARARRGEANQERSVAARQRRNHPKQRHKGGSHHDKSKHGRERRDAQRREPNRQK